MEVGGDVRGENERAREMTPQRALTLWKRLTDSITLLIIHGIITDAERDRAYKRLNVWAKKSWLTRKGTTGRKGA